ncbi:MAG: hypothetical protein J0M11_04425 [Anaerolineae bacterium]|nr:hypothetical protein [Anaerolineae bacterium]
MIQNNAARKETIGKLILNIGSIPAIIVGGLLSIGGLLLFLGSIGNTSEGTWVNPSGFGGVIGILALIPGAFMFSLLYLCRLGPRNKSLTILGACVYLLMGLAGIVFLITAVNEYNIGLVFPLTILSPIAIITGLSSLIGWWFRGLFNLSSVEEHGDTIVNNDIRHKK